MTSLFTTGYSTILFSFSTYHQENILSVVATGLNNLAGSNAMSKILLRSASAENYLVEVGGSLEQE